MAGGEKAKIEILDEEGNVVETIPLTEANEDWLRASRLKNSDDPEDKKKLDRMNNTPVYKTSDDNEEEKS